MNSQSQEESKKKSWGFYVLALVIVIIAIIIMGAIVEACWNYTLVDLTGIKKINLTQSIVLVILVHALFGGVMGASACNAKCS